MKKAQKLLTLALSLVLVLSLCACGASGGANTSAPAAVADQATAAAEAPIPEPMEMETAMYNTSADTGYGGLNGVGLAEELGSQSKSAEVNPDKIIYSADVTVETTAFDEAVQGVIRLMEECGGWIESSSVNDANYYSRARGFASHRSAYYTLRVPSDKFTALMGNLSTLGNVPYTHTYTENVTAQYYDVQARLTAYTTQEARLLEMMEAAESVSDVIAIEEKLTELRYQIESLQSTLNNYDRRVNYSSIYLSLEEVQEYTPETVVELSYGQQLGRAVARGFRNAGRFFSNLLIDLAASLPTIIFLAVAIPAAVLMLKKRKAKKAAKKASKSQTQDN